MAVLSPAVSTSESVPLSGPGGSPGSITFLIPLIHLMISPVLSLFSFFFKFIYFYTILKVTLHLQLLQNISYVLHVV